jgi:neopullulanase
VHLDRRDRRSNRRILALHPAIFAAAACLPGCCGRESPIWLEVEALVVAPGATETLALRPLVVDDRLKGLSFEAQADPESRVIVELVEGGGDLLEVTLQPDFEGETVVDLVAEDRCGNVATTELVVTTEGATTVTPSGATLCPAAIAYTAAGDPDAVAVAGPFNDWSTEDDLLEFDGVQWVTELRLPPGAHPYKLVEVDETAFEPVLGWTCDPTAAYIQCDADYKQPWEIGLVHDCVPGGRSCNSMLVVEPCDVPRLESTALDVNAATGQVHLEAAVTAGPNPVASVEATLDGAPLTVEGTDAVTVDLTLDPGRHTIRIAALDERGGRSEELYIPVWIDERDWTDQVLYFAFVDRLWDGDPELGAPEGATATGGDYEGGDLPGLVAMLPLLEDLGVTTLWLSNLQDNAEGAWDGDCGLTYAGYHQYWPDDALGVEEHFGTSADLHDLVEGAHARGMRVIVDWVANHVHQDHPYAIEHPEWFGAYAFCKDSVDGQLNFDRIPETCWFAPYLPDIDYANPEPLQVMVDDAIWWARTYGFDGFRVDAVKHMNHAVAWNLRSAIEAKIEHRRVPGPPGAFYTVGETFDGADRIASYVGDHQLHGQFDFPLYYAIRSTLAYGAGEMGDLLAAYDASKAVFGDAPMSTFLGNHDVNRFVTDAWQGWQDPCDGGQIRVADPPFDAWPYDRLMLGWTFLFTMPGIPLVYYGDELGIPGNPDPDNRQPMWWHTGDLTGVSSVEDLAARVLPDQARVLRHVQALTRARHAHPALRTGGWVEWWREPDLIAYGRSSGGDHALVVLNRSDTPRALTNGLGFAGLPQGRYVDALTGLATQSDADQITVNVPARGSAVLVWEGQ